MRAHNAQPRWLTLMASLPASSVVERAGARRGRMKAFIGSHAKCGRCQPLIDAHREWLSSGASFQRLRQWSPSRSVPVSHQRAIPSREHVRARWPDEGRRQAPGQASARVAYRIGAISVVVSQPRQDVPRTSRSGYRRTAHEARGYPRQEVSVYGQPPASGFHPAGRRTKRRGRALRGESRELGSAIRPVVADDDGWVLGRTVARGHPGLAPRGAQVTDAMAQ